MMVISVPEKTFALTLASNAQVPVPLSLRFPILTARNLGASIFRY